MAGVAIQPGLGVFIPEHHNIFRFCCQSLLPYFFLACFFFYINHKICSPCSSDPSRICNDDSQLFPSVHQFSLILFCHYTLYSSEETQINQNNAYQNKYEKQKGIPEKLLTAVPFLSYLIINTINMSILLTSLTKAS